MDREGRALPEESSRRKPGSICGRPPLARGVSGACAIACDHMSGLFLRLQMTAAKMGSATRAPNMNMTC